MRLTILREHYSSKDNKNWVPKKSFASPEEVKKVLGANVLDENIYECTVCHTFHSGRVKSKDKVS
jgi:hypothetical protein